MLVQAVLGLRFENNSLEGFLSLSQINCLLLSCILFKSFLDSPELATVTSSLPVTGSVVLSNCPYPPSPPSSFACLEHAPSLVWWGSQCRAQGEAYWCFDSYLQRTCSALAVVIPRSLLGAHLRWKVESSIRLAQDVSNTWLGAWGPLMWGWGWGLGCWARTLRASWQAGGRRPVRGGGVGWSSPL